MLISDHGFHRGTGRPASIAPIPAGHAEEHSDFGIFVLRGPGIRKDHLVHGTSVLDVAPTLLALCGLPIGEDMDGRVVTEAFETPPVVVGIPSWDDVPGDDGSHPDDLKSDPVGDRAALDQLIALGYVQKLSDNFEDAVRQTQRELDLNRAESLLDGNREADAIPILRRLCDEWPDEWRLHFRLAMACKSLGRVQELRDAVDRLQSRRDECLSARADILKWRDEIRARILARKAGQPATDTIIDEDEAEVFNAIEAEPPTTTGEPCELDATANREAAQPPLLTVEERSTLKRLNHLASLNTFGIDFLQAVVALAENRADDAVELLQRAEEGLATRPGLYLQIGESYQRLKRWDDAIVAFQRALELDPENAHAHVGIAGCRIARREWSDARDSAVLGLRSVYRYALRHFYIGVASQRLNEPQRAQQAFELVLSINPGFWPAHVRLSRLLKDTNPARAAWHRTLAESARQDAEASTTASLDSIETHDEFAANAARSATQTPARDADTAIAVNSPPEILGSPRPPFVDNVVTLVTGLPRSGTSLLMQMLAAGGLEPLTDEQRVADADNPRGYYELNAVKALKQNNTCMKQAVDKAVKVVLPLLPHVPSDLKYHVILIERNLDEILTSQRTMLDRNAQTAHDPALLRPAYERLLKEGRRSLENSPIARTLRLQHRWVLENPDMAATVIDAFLGTTLNRDAMAAVVDCSLHRAMMLDA